MFFLKPEEQTSAIQAHRTRSYPETTPRTLRLNTLRTKDLEPRGELVTLLIGSSLLLCILPGSGPGRPEASFVTPFPFTTTLPPSRFIWMPIYMNLFWRHVFSSNWLGFEQKTPGKRKNVRTGSIVHRIERCTRVDFSRNSPRAPHPVLPVLTTVPSLLSPCRGKYHTSLFPHHCTFCT